MDCSPRVALSLSLSFGRTRVLIQPNRTSVSLLERRSPSRHSLFIIPNPSQAKPPPAPCHLQLLSLPIFPRDRRPIIMQDKRTTEKVPRSALPKLGNHSSNIFLVKVSDPEIPRQTERSLAGETRSSRKREKIEWALLVLYDDDLDLDNDIRHSTNGKMYPNTPKLSTACARLAGWLAWLGWLVRRTTALSHCVGGDPVEPMVSDPSDGRTGQDGLVGCQSSHLLGVPGRGLRRGTWTTCHGDSLAFSFTSPLPLQNATRPSLSISSLVTNGKGSYHSRTGP